MAVLDREGVLNQPISSFVRFVLVIVMRRFEPTYVNTPTPGTVAPKEDATSSTDTRNSFANGTNAELASGGSADAMLVMNTLSGET